MTTRRDIIKGGAGLAAILAACKAPAYVRSMWGARNALMAGRRSPLPPGARWVEYLESTGTQWIDTGVIPDDTTGYYVRCYANSVGGNKVPCGQREDSGNTRWYVNFSNALEFAWNSYLGVGAYNANTWYDIGFNWMNSRTGTKDGSTVFNISQQLTTRTRTAYAFANHGSPGAANAFAGKIASLKISQGTSLIRDFRPIAIGTTGYMLDMVSGQYLPYGNAGTGDFVLGPDVVPVEYIESHGTEWIDTGVFGNLYTRIEIAIEKINNSEHYAVCGFFLSGSSAQITVPANTANNSGLYARFGDTYIASGMAVSVDKHTISSDRMGLAVDGVLRGTFGATADFTTPDSLAIFRFKGLDRNFFIGRMFSCRVYENGVLVRSFRPVRVGTDATSWEGAMMDTLTRRICRNAGTGTFGYGNDLPLDTLAN